MRPNILMLFPDQWRADWIGALGGLPLRTPNIDALLARGTGFARAWTPSPLCAPARSCFATGRAYGRAPVRSNFDDNPLDTPTFYRALREAGYQVANTGKSDLLKHGHSWGPDGRHVVDGEDRLAALGFSHGFDSAGKKAAEVALKRGFADPYTEMLKARGLEGRFLDDYAGRGVVRGTLLQQWLDGSLGTPPDAYANVDPQDLPDDAYNDNFVGQRTLDELKGFDPNSPWFMIVNFPGPHEPMDVTPSMAEAWEGVEFPLPRMRNTEDAELQQDIRRRYAAMIENIDRWIGRYIAHLEETGQLDNTVIVFASDHGEMLGDRNLWKKQVPFEASVRVPMILAGPGIKRRAMVDEGPANLLDLPPTFLALAQTDPLDGMEGYSLLDYLDGSAPYPRASSESGLGAWRAATDGRFKIIVGLNERINQEMLQTETYDPACLRSGVLYDLADDPDETRSLWDDRPDVRDSLIAHIARVWPS
ncbi:sulfatase family protein [Pelagibacterium halotolerans]|uniref:Choline-sulfatase n=1 Tax=Pelagibacterium halotolerans (strain DSM 22347 / JCM 15775 / CGMCC 1.7692 / B2) TaxID=1082931 RepID=G4R7E5_PELHB|nr:sulfatase-like hydrolase/transferase [Pelagibacterium halotolerans]AEQ51283.1 choline-sulfatase [Pelagibacterium halotolerans B2]QJR18860.1 sulfatase-like hydrolase/transferase [Pelagibacterium halotolerans]SEA66484.1 Arylsulfatase A [Pelagibacterium halotolerans]